MERKVCAAGIDPIYLLAEHFDLLAQPGISAVKHSDARFQCQFPRPLAKLFPQIWSAKVRCCPL